MIKGKITMLITILTLMAFAPFFIINTNAQTGSPIVFVAPIPCNSGFSQQASLTVTANSGNTATFNLLLSNPTFETESVPIYVDSSEYTTITLFPYQYEEVPITLSQGLHKITVNGQLLYVNVTQSSYSPVTTYINGSANVYKLNAQPGHTYVFSVSYSYYPNNTFSTNSVYSDIGFFNPYQHYYQAASSTLSTINTFLVQIPNGIPQGVYFAYVYTYWYNGTTGKILDSSLGFVIINVSYGLSTSIFSSSSTFSENGVNIEMQNISGSTYLFLQYPFSFENEYSITINGKTISITNLTTTNNAYPAYVGASKLEYYGSEYPMAFSSDGILIKLPQFGTANIEISTPSGQIPLSIPPTKITSTLGKLSVNVLSSNGIPIPNAKVIVNNISTSELIFESSTNSSGITTFSLPIGQQVKVIVSAQGYYQNETIVTVYSSSSVKIYLTPVKINVTAIAFNVNGSKVIPLEISPSKYFVNESIGSNISILFSVTLNNNNATPIVTATINGTTQVKVTSVGNNEYSLSYRFISPGIYYINITANYNGASQSMLLKVNIYKPIITTTTTSSVTQTSPPSSSTTVPPSSTSTTTSSTTTSTSTSSTTTTTKTSSTQPSTLPIISTSPTSSAALPITDIAIVVAVIVIAAVAAVIILRR